MTPQALVIFAVPLTLLMVAVVVDVRSRRIPDWLAFTLMCTGIMQSFTAGATVGPWAAVLGLLVGGMLLLPQFALRALGGGDVKLLAGIGAWVGAAAAFEIFLADAVCGMCVAITQSLMHGRMKQMLRNSALLALNVAHVRRLGMEHTAATGESARSIDKPVPYAVPILLGMVIVLLGGGGMR